MRLDYELLTFDTYIKKFDTRSIISEDIGLMIKNELFSVEETQ